MFAWVFVRVNRIEKVTRQAKNGDCNGDFMIYRIRPDYRTVRLGFFKITRKLEVKYVSTSTKGTLKQRSVKDSSNDAYAILLCCCFFVLFFLSPVFLIKAYVVGTHLNCIDKSM